MGVAVGVGVGRGVGAGVGIRVGVAISVGVDRGAGIPDGDVVGDDSQPASASASSIRTRSAGVRKGQRLRSAGWQRV